MYLTFRSYSIVSKACLRNKRTTMFHYNIISHSNLEKKPHEKTVICLPTQGAAHHQDFTEMWRSEHLKICLPLFSIMSWLVNFTQVLHGRWKATFIFLAVMRLWPRDKFIRTYRTLEHSVVFITEDRTEIVKVSFNRPRVFLWAWQLLDGFIKKEE